MGLVDFVDFVDVIIANIPIGLEQKFLALKLVVHILMCALYKLALAANSRKSAGPKDPPSCKFFYGLNGHNFCEHSRWYGIKIFGTKACSTYFNVRFV